MNRLNRPSALAVCAALTGTLAVASPVAAQQADPSPAGLATKLENPLSDIITIPIQVNWKQGVGPAGETQTVTNVQPVVPFSLNRRWNLITRVVMPFIWQPAAVGSAAGAGDAVASGFFSPRLVSHGITWGVGPVVNVPFTTDPTLGNGKWSAGPTAVVMKQQGHVMYGALVNQVWSFADRGDAPRTDVSQMLFQPVLSYITGTGVTIRVMSEMTANWKAASGERWTIPVTAVVSKIERIGVLPVSVQIGGGVYLAAPQGGPSWQLRTGVVVVFPKGRR